MRPPTAGGEVRGHVQQVLRAEEQAAFGRPLPVEIDEELLTRHVRVVRGEMVQGRAEREQVAADDLGIHRAGGHDFATREVLAAAEILASCGT